MQVGDGLVAFRDRSTPDAGGWEGSGVGHSTEGPPEALSGFCERLRRLQRASGITQRNLARAVGVSEQQLSDILNGKIQRLPPWPRVRAMVEACRNHAVANARSLPPDLVSADAWRSRYFDLEQDLDVSGRTPVRSRATSLRGFLAQGREQPARVSTVGQVPQRLVAAWDAIDLGVHRAIDTGDAFPVLPLYLQRAHDNKIRQLLERADRPVMVLLVGGSSTGKTRACFEAATQCLRDWWLVKPTNAVELIESLAGRRVGTGTVVWLNETQNYLDGPEGASAAVVLRRVLTGGSEPLVVLGSMWPHFWLKLTTRPDRDQPDPHAQARELLEVTSVHKVDVPDDFSSITECERARLNELISRDGRLSIAVRAAAQSQKVTQVLAGGVELVDRYEHTMDSWSKVILTAAMDAQRLGHRSVLPPDLLEQAAPGYLGPGERAVTDDWFAVAVDKTTEQVRGIRALDPVRIKPGIGRADGYELHDYLAQYGRKALAGELPPTATWDALVNCSTDSDDRVRLGESAQMGFLYWHALGFWAPAASAGNFAAFWKLVRWLRGREPKGPSMKYYKGAQRWAHETGHEGELFFTAHSAWLRWAADGGHVKAMMETFTIGQLSVLLRPLAEAGNAEAMRELARMLYFIEEKNNPVCQGSDLETLSMRRRAPLFSNGEIRLWRRRAAEAGDVIAMRELARDLRLMGTREESLAWALRAVEAGDIETMTERADWSREDALDWLRMCAETGFPPAFRGVCGAPRIRRTVGRRTHVVATGRRSRLGFRDVPDGKSA